MVATIGDVPLLVAVKDAIFPVPVPNNPIAGLELVQVYDVAPTVLLVVKLIAVVASPLQTIWLVG
jgi:hypothetical protein